jgi:DNA-binding transcriptional MerR regulator
MMRIGELAQRTGATTKAIRYYESLGLLPQPDRTASDYRDYGLDAIERVRFIKDAQAGGLTLTEIQSLVELKTAGQATCEHTIDLLHRHLADIDTQIRQLEAARSSLAALAERAATLDHADCTNPHRCHVIAAGARHPT